VVTLVGLLGDGILQSLTPPMHRREAAELGLDYEYRILDIAETGDSVDDLPRLFADVRGAGFDALNVTHPFKQHVIPLLDELSPAAGLLGAVNLVLFAGGRAVGHNTDWTGFRRAVASGLGDIRHDRVVQVGAGGAGAATAYALLDLGVQDLVVVDLDPERSASLAERFRTATGREAISSTAFENLDAALAEAGGVVHATPVGMTHSPGLPFAVSALAPAAWVAEVVYVPLRTELVQQAEAAGHRVLDGGRMAVGQAVDSIRLITGIEPDPVRMRAHFLELIADVPEGGSDR
jgi:shikimate dehydrogenase